MILDRKAYWLTLIIICTSLPLIMEAQIKDSNMLEQTISLPKTKASIYSLLNLITQQTGLLFIYDSDLVDNEKKVRINEGTRSVKNAVEEIIGRNDTKLELIGHHILITQDRPDIKVPLPIQDEIILEGEIVDSENNEPVPFVTLGIEGSSNGIVSNQEGRFKLNINSHKDSLITVSHIGYETQKIDAKSFKNRFVHISLVPKSIQIKEIMVKAFNPIKLINSVENSRKNNYFLSPIQLTTFYREGIYYNDKFRMIVEAVFKLYKTSYRNSFSVDQVKLEKMRRISDFSTKDTLIAKMSSGVDACLQLDLIKNTPDFLSPQNNSSYKYAYVQKTEIENRPAHVIYFEQKKEVTSPLYCGHLYIDSASNALLQVDMEISPARIKDATSIFVVKPAPKLKLTTKKVAYSISYKEIGSKYYINHIRGDLFFKVKGKRLFGNSELHTWFEMVSCKADTANVVSFKRNDRIPTHSIFSETKYTYDDKFWDDYSTIPLEEEISKVIQRLTPKIETLEDY